MSKTEAEPFAGLGFCFGMKRVKNKNFTNIFTNDIL